MTRIVSHNRLLAVHFVRRLARWNKWYDSKVPLFFVCMYYAALSRPQLDVGLLGEMALLLIILCFYAGFGHMANDYSDRAVDRVVDKPNPLATLSEKRGRTLVILAAIGGLLPVAFIYRERPDIVALVCFAYALAALYSLPPIRLKERGLLGLIAAAAAQRTLPALIIFRALDVWDWTAAAICVLCTLIGLRHILVHQIEDLKNDARTGVRTFGTGHGAPYLRWLITWIVFPLELSSLVVAVVTMSSNLPAVGVMGALYALLLTVQLRLRRRLERPVSPVSYSLLADFYYVYWPLLLATLLSVRNIAFFAALALNILWQAPMLKREIRGTIQLVNETRRRLAAKRAD